MKCNIGAAGDTPFVGRSALGKLGKRMRFLYAASPTLGELS